jgi:hypothetical protein
LSLAVSVATRFIHYYTLFHTSTAVQNNASLQKRQDLEKDAPQWTPPAPQIAILRPPIPCAAPPSVEISRSEVLLVEALYNRSPPAC